MILHLESIESDTGSRMVSDPPIECKSGDTIKITSLYSIDAETHEIGDGVITSVKKEVRACCLLGRLFSEGDSRL